MASLVPLGDVDLPFGSDARVSLGWGCGLAPVRGGGVTWAFGDHGGKRGAEGEGQYGLYGRDAD